MDGQYVRSESDILFFGRMEEISAAGAVNTKVDLKTININSRIDMLKRCTSNHSKRLGCIRCGMVWYRHTISKYCVQSNSQMEGMDNDEQSHKPNGGVNQVKTNVSSGQNSSYGRSSSSQRQQWQKYHLL